MAYQQSFNDDDEEKKQQGQSNEQVLSSESQSINTAPGSTTPSTQPAQKGSGYTNLSQYVEANRPQAAGMAEKIAQGIDTQAQQQKSNIQSFQADASKRAQEATVQDKGVVDSLASSPDKFAQQQWQDLFKQQTAGYKGPQSAEELGSYQNVAGKQQRLDSSVQALGTNEGRAQAAKETFKPLDAQYNQGENLLDTFLLGTGGGAEKLQQFQKSYQDQNLAKQWQDTVAGATNQFNQAKNTTNATKQATETALKNATQGLESKFSGYGNQVEQEQAQNADALARLQSSLYGENSWDANSRRNAYNDIGLGFDQGEWLRSQGMDLSKLISEGQSRSVGDLAQDQEIEGYKALLGLQGRDSQIDLSRTGQTATPYTTNKDLIDTSRVALDLKAALDNRVKDSQAARDREYAKASEAATIPLSARVQQTGLSPQELDAFSQVFGISSDDYKYAADKGLINPEFLRKGVELNHGDVASDAERQQWGQIMQKLGIAGDINLQDLQDEGSAYQADSTGLLNRISAARLSDAAALEDKQRRDAQAAREARVMEEYKQKQGRATVPGVLQTDFDVQPTLIDDKKLEKNKKRQEGFVGSASVENPIFFSRG